MSAALTSSVTVAGIDKPISRLALGTAFFRAEAQGHWHALLDALAEHGGTVLDTARGYGDSESVVGSWLAAMGSRERMVVCTKGGHGDGVLPRDGLEAIIERELAESLRALQTDYVDLFYLHRDNPSVPVGRIVECLNEHLARGRIRALGASNWAYARLDEANGYAAARGLAGFAAASNHFSLALQAEAFYPGLVETRRADLPWHARTGIPLLPWSSQARGFFTGRYRPGHEAEDGFARRMVEVYGTEDNLERLRRAEQLGGQRGCSATAIALAWVLHRGSHVVPIVGPRTREELGSCVAAAATELSPQEVRWLDLEL